MASDGPDCLPGHLDRAHLADFRGINTVTLWSDEAYQRAARQAIARRDLPIEKELEGFRILKASWLPTGISPANDCRQ